MHAQSTSSADIARYERFLSTLRVPDSLKAGLAYDDDDVRNECRLVAYNAIARFRERGGPRDEEARYVRRAVKNHFIDTIRRAERQCRCPDATAIGTIQTSAHGTTSFDVEAGHGSVEVALLEEERRASLRRAARAIRSELGEVAYRQALLRVDGEGWSGIVSDAEKNAAKCRYRRSLVRARRFLGADTLKDVERRFGGTMSAEMEIEKLSDENLARVAIVHGVSLEKLDRAHLVAQVRAINTDHESGASYGFPPCFASSSEYDPSDAACAEECDFRVECSACLPQYRSDVVEAALVQLRSKSEAKPKPAAAPTPAAPAADPTPAAAAKPKAEKPKKGKPAAETPEKPATAELYRAEKWPPEKPKDEGADEGETPAATETAAKAAKKSTTKKAAKAAAKSKPAKKESVPVVGVFLSERRGVFRQGQKEYKLRPDGSRWYRAPSGSAAELAYLPVGHERTRDWDGYRYHVVKIKDGPTRQMPSGDLRKRDGVWRLDWRAKILANGELGEKQVYKDPMEDSLGKITFHITGNRAWSAARFFAVLPPALDRTSKAFDPKKFAPDSPYRYESGGQPAAKKAANKAASPKKSATKKAANKAASPKKSATKKAAKAAAKSKPAKKSAAKKKTKVVVKAKPKAAKKAAKKSAAKKKTKVVVKKKPAKKSAAKKRAA